MIRTKTPESRLVIAIAVVVLGVAVLLVTLRHAAAASQDHSAATTAQGCGTTYIRGVTENKTGMALRVATVGQNASNKWCREPEDVHAHATNAWLAGDESGPTVISVSYLLGNGDHVFFQARLTKNKQTAVGCSFVEVVRTPREYECQAEDVASAGSVAAVRFTVRPFTPPGNGK